MLNDCTLANDLDHQFGDLPVGLRKILLNMIHGFAGNPYGQLHLHLLGGHPGIWSLAGRNWFKCYRYFNAGLQGPYNGGRYVWDRRISGDIKRDEIVIANFTRRGPALLGVFVIFFVADARL